MEYRSFNPLVKFIPSISFFLIQKEMGLFFSKTLKQNYTKEKLSSVKKIFHKSEVILIDPTHLAKRSNLFFLFLICV